MKGREFSHGLDMRQTFSTCQMASDSYPQWGDDDSRRGILYSGEPSEDLLAKAGIPVRLQCCQSNPSLQVSTSSQELEATRKFSNRCDPKKRMEVLEPM